MIQIDKNDPRTAHSRTLFDVEKSITGVDPASAIFSKVSANHSWSTS